MANKTLLRRITNYSISKIKGQPFEIDSNVSNGYLISLLLSKAFMMLRGFLVFPFRANRLFIGRSVSLKCRDKFRFGKGCQVNSGALIDALSIDGVRFGNNVSLGKRCVIECSGSIKRIGKGMIVGNNVGLGRDCFYGCAGGVEIGDDTIIGNFVSFHSENHNADDIHIPIRLQAETRKGIKVGNNCWLGAKVTILDGAIIGEGCIIAAGAVVAAGYYEPNSIYGGVPAKLLKKRG